MPQLIKYLLDTGAIVGVWQSNTADSLDAQIVEGDLVYGYLPCDLPIAAYTLEQDYIVVEGDVVPRPAAREER